LSIVETLKLRGERANALTTDVDAVVKNSAEIWLAHRARSERHEREVSAPLAEH